MPFGGAPYCREPRRVFCLLIALSSIIFSARFQDISASAASSPPWRASILHSHFFAATPPIRQPLIAASRYWYYIFFIFIEYFRIRYVIFEYIAFSWLSLPFQYISTSLSFISHATAFRRLDTSHCRSSAAGAAAGCHFPVFAPLSSSAASPRFLQRPSCLSRGHKAIEYAFYFSLQ